MTLNDNPRGGTPGSAERDPGLDRVYRAGANEAPPAHLDAAILAAARREVGARPVRVSPGLRRWRVPVSLAAVVVLSVSLVTLVKEEGGDTGSDLLRQAPSNAMPPAAMPAQPAPAAPAENRSARPRGTEPAAPRADAGAGEAIGKAAESSLASASGPQGTTATGVASEPAPKPSPQPFRDTPSLAERSVPASPPGSASLDQAARAPVAAERRVAPMTAITPAPESAGARVMGQARKEAAFAEDRPLPVWQGYEKEPPQKWLERIEALRRQQRVADAEAMLVEFRRRFPGYPLPTGQP